MNELDKWKQLNIKRKTIWRQLFALNKEAYKIDQEIMKLNLVDIGYLLSEETEQSKKGGSE